MAIIIPSADFGDLSDIARQARRLADGLDALSTSRPSAADLKSAPMLLDCTFSLRLTPAFTGFVTGHPRIHAGRRTMTSEVFAFDPDAYGPGVGWAQTWSRLYRIVTADAYRGKRQ